MSGRESAIAVILELAKKVANTIYSMEGFYPDWQKESIYRLKFVAKNEVAGSGVKRTEYFFTNDDNRNIFKILKLADTLLQTVSYENLEMDYESLKLSANFAGKGSFSITIRLLNGGNNLQVSVTTYTGGA